MKLNEIRDNKGATHAPKRVGRGMATGWGKTCARGVKGQKSRSGVSIKGFEGGQMPIHMRLPKRGFNSLNPTNYRVVNLGYVQKAIDEGRLDAKKTLTASVLEEAGLVRRGSSLPVRLLGKGELKSKCSFEIQKASKSAEEAVTKAGGKVSIVELPKAAKAEKTEAAPKAAAPKKPAAKKAPAKKAPAKDK